MNGENIVNDSVNGIVNGSVGDTVSDSVNGKAVCRKRNTLQKQIILRHLRTLANHPTAQQVYESVHSEYPSISRATVYRDLSEAAATGQILRINIAGETHYDHFTPLHYHLKCRVCGKVCDVFMKQEPDILHAVAPNRSTDCITENYSIEFQGICLKCADNLDNKK